jgi:tRNA dimethylallyltransferase
MKNEGTEEIMPAERAFVRRSRSVIICSKLTMPEKKKILIIAGPTAVGKTETSLLLASETNAEIVSADSMQIYRHMDIGTAKPTREQRARVRHHMIDIVEPDQPYSVGDYLRDARSAMDRILASGGTNVDPAAAVKIHPNDVRRTIRALEVFYLREKKLSDFQREHSFSDRPYSFHLFFLVRSRKELYSRIERRVDQMLEEGLEGEVKGMIQRGYNAGLSSMQGLGYKHFMDHFLGATSREEAIALLKRDTKRYAKRQFTWFRREPEAVWIDTTGLERAQDLAERIKKSIDISNRLV